MNENMEPLVKKLGDADNYFESDSCAFQERIRYILMEVLR